MPSLAMKLVNETKNISTITLAFSILLLLLPIRHVISQCSPDQWMCDNQQSCIDGDDVCDGRTDCSDGSDESAVNCFKSTTCPKYSFQCSYGACIKGQSECDGIADCADKSDELFCKKNVAATNLQGTCSSDDEIQCLSSMECIDSDNRCDGRLDCSDGSDETLEMCGREMCPTGFRCAYGACVSGSAVCNGTRECPDGSDEALHMCGNKREFPKTTTTVQPMMSSSFKPLAEGLPCNGSDEALHMCGNKRNFPKTTTTVQPMMRSSFKPLAEGLPCKIPDGLARVVVTMVTSAKRLLPGNLVDDDVSINAKCESKNDYGVDLFCYNGSWQGDFPKCNVFCDTSKLNGISTTYVCFRNTILSERFCKPNIVANTSISVYCSPGYVRSTSPQLLQCQVNGEFSEKRRPCQQQCGQFIPDVSSLTRHGYHIIPSNAPWHVSIYRNDSGDPTHICGGSIISPRLIISAAHCFWNRTIPTSPDLYQIIAGKLTKKYDVDQSEGIPQIIDVERIHISDNYTHLTGITNHFYADIAILKLKTHLIFNENVSAICMHYPRGDSNDEVKSNVIGSITGFGLSGILERLSMGTISNEECQRLRDGQSLAGDKFCLRNVNINSTLCLGDSGGGFVTKYNDAFYLLGVISYTPATKRDCVTAEFVGMSNVRYMRKDLFNVWQREIQNDEKLF